MYGLPPRRTRRLLLGGAGVVLAVALTPTGSVQAGPPDTQIQPTFTAAAAFDVSRPLRDLPTVASGAGMVEERAERSGGPTAANRGYAGDRALQTDAASRDATSARDATAARLRDRTVGPTLANFEGLS